MATGLVERGIVRTGDELEVVGISATQKTTCTGVEMFKKLLDQVYLFIIISIIIVRIIIIY